MREFKFRAWSINHNTMLYNIGIAPDNDKIDWTISSGSDGTYVNPKNSIGHYIVMQFTGMKDKNGRDIYEGDVVKLIEPNRLYTVEWMYYTFKLIHLDPKLDRMMWGGIERLVELNWGIEIIGDIYENSNLLES